MEQQISKPILECLQLSKSYLQGSTTVDVLKDITFQLTAGQRIAIIGVSGSGKSTLLNLLGALDTASQGQVKLNEQDLATLNDNQLSQLRNSELGFVYQFHHLLPEFTAQENVAMPLLIAGVSKVSARKQAEQILTRVGLEHRLKHRPDALSGGERQRVAIARALINNPSCVLMDEPTGNLDQQSSLSIQSLIDELAQESKTAFIVVTHDHNIAKLMDEVYELEDGTLHRKTENSTIKTSY